MEKIRNGTCGEHLIWVLENGTLTISGTGDMYDYDLIDSPCEGCKKSDTIPAAPWYDDRDLIRTVEVQEGVTSIGNLGFFDCKYLTSITLPDSITSIGEKVFYGCSMLTALTLPSGITQIGNSAFFACGSLTALTLPDGITQIGCNAFLWCSSLTSVKLPDSVTHIGEAAFFGCHSLTTITLPSGITQIGCGVFSCCASLTALTLPSGITQIGCGAFSGCSSLTTITLPSGITQIGNLAFYGCSSLTSIEIPESVTSIGEQAFSDCSSLTAITLPSGITSIDKEMFSGCSSLASIEIPESVTDIGSHAFSGTALQEVCLPRRLTWLGWNAFENVEEIIVYDDTPLDTAGSSGAKMVTLKSAETGRIRYKVWMQVEVRGKNCSRFWYHTTFDFAKQDRLFPELQNVWSKYMTARTRLEYPEQLTPDQREIYLNFLCESVPEIVQQATAQGTMDVLFALEKLGAICSDNIGALIDCAVEQGQPEITALLLDMRSRLGAAADDFAL